MKKVLNLFRPKKQWIWTIGKWGGVLAVVLIVCLGVFPALTVPKIGLKALVVLSGSMEPTIKTGSVVITKPISEVKEGEVITFKHPLGSFRDLVTHRVVKIETKEGITEIKTKGDANKVEDSWTVGPGAILGKVIFSVPYLGFVVGFVRQPLGFVIFVVLSAFLIIVEEILRIKKTIEAEYRQKYENPTRGRRRKNKVRKEKGIALSEVITSVLVVAMAVFTSGSCSLAGITHAYFSDQDKSEGNTFSAGCWVKPTTSQLIYPTNGYLAGLGSDWLANPYMDWSDSSTTCPGGVISYQYESYHDAGLTSLAYRSLLLADSMIPAPGTPDGTYYWRARAFDGSNWSDWSEVWLLTVDRSVPPPSPGSDNSPSGTPATSPPYLQEIIINEFLPNPAGNDDADKLGGEWVELYNRSDSAVDVDGWYLYDAFDTHALPINSGRTNTGNTQVPNHGFLVVYRDGDSDFSLDEDAGGDTVRLYNGSISTGTLVDSHIYTGPVAENKSIARYPDGTDTWYDPIPTPGGPNQLEPEETDNQEEDSQDEAQLVEEPAQENPEVVSEDEAVSEEIEEVDGDEIEEEVIEEPVEEEEVVPEAEGGDDKVKEEIDKGEIIEPSEEAAETIVVQSEGAPTEESGEPQEEIKPQDVKPEEEQEVVAEDNSEEDNSGKVDEQSPADEPQSEPQSETQPETQPQSEIDE